MKRAVPKDGPESIAADSPTVTLTPDELAYIGEVSREIGRREAEQAMATHWSRAVAGIKPVLRQPTYAERLAARAS